MWYDYYMPAQLPQTALDEAVAAVAFAQQVRKRHRRRTRRDDQRRLDDIADARARLTKAMEPLRSEIGRFQYGPQTPSAEANRQQIREASLAIQTERRKLSKMSARKES